MTSAAPLAPATRFVLPPGAEATQPPERRGLSRDGVRLLTAGPGQSRTHRFRDLPELLEPGDLVVVNTSATLAAALDATRADGRTLPMHVATVLADDAWVVEFRRADGSGPDLGGVAGQRLRLPGGLEAELVAPHPERLRAPSRLWRVALSHPVDAAGYLERHGRPIGYGYLAGRFPLADFQTLFATEPGSAEMPSAGRPFTTELVLRLLTRGVAVAPLVLHTGVSSPELNEPPQAERFRVPEPTARLVNSTRAAGRRVVAVGTTVVRALESAAGPDGTVRAAAGWTDLVLGPDRPARVVDGLITGLHAPEASHLLLLEAVAGAGLVADAYAVAVAERYLWHEFGDAMLFLPDPRDVVALDQSLITESTLPAGSLNQAMSGPPPRKMPFSSVATSLRS
jgi:S-adenosylmethionine:tRNA ribosyltransferase-isomerase